MQSEKIVNLNIISHSVTNLSEVFIGFALSFLIVLRCVNDAELFLSELSVDLFMFSCLAELSIDLTLFKFETKSALIKRRYNNGILLELKHY